MAWGVFIDESGSTSAPPGGFVVAGVLVQAGAFDSIELALALEQLAPEMPWPPHACDYQRLSPWLAWADAKPDRSPWLANDVRVSAIAELEAKGSGDWNALKQAVATSTKLPYEPVRRLDSLLSTGARPSLAGRRASFVTGLHAVLTDLTRRAAIRLVVASESAPRLPRHGDPYLRLLGSVLKRCLQAIAAPGGASLSAEVLGRDVASAVLGRAIPLRPPDIREALARATGRPGGSVESAEGTARMAAAEVRAFDASTRAELVAADWAANQARRVLELGGELDQVLHGLELQTGLLASRNGRPLVTTPDTPSTSIEFAWGVQQAEFWP